MSRLDLLIGLHLVAGGRIVTADSAGRAVVQHGDRLRTTTFHTLTLTEASAAELQRRLDEACPRTHDEPDPAPASQTPEIRVGDRVSLEESPGRYLFWTVTACDHVGITLDRDNEVKRLRWHALWPVYRGRTRAKAAS